LPCLLVAGGYLNSSTGELVAPVPSDVTSIQKILFQNPPAVSNPPGAVWGPGGSQWWLGAVWTLSWDGNLSTNASPVSVIGSIGTGGSPGISSIGANSATVKFGNATPPNNMGILFKIDATNSSNPPHNIKFYQSKFAAQVASPDPATANIEPNWLSQWSSIGMIRWMPETGGDTNQNNMVDYAQLAGYNNYNSFGNNGSFTTNSTKPIPLGAFGPYGPKGSISPSTVCLVQNKIGAHAHYNLPMAANAGFASGIATEFNGCMNPGLIVKYEYCNEIWNFGGNFWCFRYMNGQPWPPLNPSNPTGGGGNYQTPISIASVVTGLSTTTINCTPDCGSLVNGNAIGFQFSSSDTISSLDNNEYNVGGCTTYPAPSFTVNYAGDTTNRQAFAGGCSSCTDTLTGLSLGTSASDVFLLATVSSGGTFSGIVTCDTQVGGTPVVMTLDNSSGAGSGFAGIFHGHLSANASATRSCTVAYSGTGASSRTRTYYVMTVNGLTSSSPDFLMPSTFTTQSGTLTANSNSLVVYSANSCAFLPVMSGSTTPSSSRPATATLASSFNTAAFSMFNPSFSSVIMSANCANSISGSATAAAYH
jgi:hypothetical protein